MSLKRRLKAKIQANKSTKKNQKNKFAQMFDDDCFRPFDNNLTTERRNARTSQIHTPGNDNNQHTDISDSFGQRWLTPSPHSPALLSSPSFLQEPETCGIMTFPVSFNIQIRSPTVQESFFGFIFRATSLKIPPKFNSRAMCHSDGDKVLSWKQQVPTEATQTKSKYRE